jgi:thiamine-phosphate pyrophosphorylase
MNKSSLDLSVYLITRDDPDMPGIVGAAISAGAGLIQYRHKGKVEGATLEMAREVRDLCRTRGVPFVVNDSVELARILEADGVHVGQTDDPPEEARKVLGPDAIIGISAENVEEAVRAEQAGADYIGAGDVFGTTSKERAVPPIGIEGLKQIVSAVSIPVVAIGGVTPENAPLTIQAGAAGISVISAIFDAPDPAEATKKLYAAVNQEVER